MGKNCGFFNKSIFWLSIDSPGTHCIVFARNYITWTRSEPSTEELTPCTIGTQQYCSNEDGCASPAMKRRSFSPRVQGHNSSLQHSPVLPIVIWIKNHYVIFYKVTKKFRAIVPYVAENIDKETANTRSALKGDALAKLKVRLYSLENLSKHQNNFIYILIFNSIHRMTMIWTPAPYSWKHQVVLIQ